MKASYQGKKNNYFIVLLIIAVVSCIITSASYASGVSSIAASAVGFVVTPLQKLVSGLQNLTEDVGVYFNGIDALKEENEMLTQKVSSLEREVSLLETAKKENEMLRSFLELKEQKSELEFIPANVISRSVSNYTKDFTIDKGSVHGIKKDMVVLSEDTSLLGIIVEVGATYSRGKTLTSYDYSVGIKNERTGSSAILSGDLELSLKNLCKVSDLYDYEDYKVGDSVCTSGLGDIYPPDIYVGKVIDIVSNPLDYTVSAIIEPSGDVFDSDTVMVTY